MTYAPGHSQEGEIYCKTFPDPMDQIYSLHKTRPTGLNNIPFPHDVQAMAIFMGFHSCTSLSLVLLDTCFGGSDFLGYIFRSSNVEWTKTKMAKGAFLGILDLDGIRLDGKFYVRELAFASDWSDLCVNQKFQLDQQAWRNASFKDRRTAYYVSENITHLPVNAHPRENSIPQHELHQFVLNLYHEFPAGGMVGYKGGTVEAELLNYLGIPSLNVEAFGCPTFKLLSDRYTDLKRFDCGHHSITEDYYHCSSMECVAFKRWWCEENENRWWQEQERWEEVKVVH